MKNYREFKIMVEYLIWLLKNEDNLTVIPKKWATISPYQKRRYKPQFQYPEVWLYRPEGHRGVAVTGDELEHYYLEGGYEKLKQVVKDYLF